VPPVPQDVLRRRSYRRGAGVAYGGPVIERLAWVTTSAARGRDEDEPLALEALRRTGLSVDVLDWDDDFVDWSRYDRVVLRSAWDYPERLPEFLSWLDRTEAVSDLVNPAATVRWNLDKHYLAELAEAGVPITPTVFAEPGSESTFPAGNFVVKPAIGAGSRDVASYTPQQRSAALAQISRMHTSGQTALIQPLLKSVAVEGEWPMIFIEGQFSHAANKRVALPQAGLVEDLFAAETNTEHVASAMQIELALAAVEVVSTKLGPPAYARVDLVRDDSGQFCVLEVELIEPSLFLPYAGSAGVERLVAALVRDRAGDRGGRHRDDGT